MKATFTWEDGILAVKFEDAGTSGELKFKASKEKFESIKTGIEVWWEPQFKETEDGFTIETEKNWKSLLNILTNVM